MSTHGLIHWARLFVCSTGPSLVYRPIDSPCEWDSSRLADPGAQNAAVTMSGMLEVGEA